jgi:deoxyribodipyrimidine photo-lyase
VAAALQAGGCKVLADWDQLLVPPEQVFTGGGDPYRVYGPFLRNWRGQLASRNGSPRRAARGVVPAPWSRWRPRQVCWIWIPPALDRLLWIRMPARGRPVLGKSSWEVPTAEDLGSLRWRGSLPLPARGAAAMPQLRAFAGGGAGGGPLAGL